MPAGALVDQQLAVLVQHFQPVDGLIAYGAEVEVQNDDGTVDLKPADPDLGPGPQHVPVAHIGPFAVKVAPGAPCLFVFQDGDRTKPVVVKYLPGTVYTEATLDATTIKIGPTATAVLLGKALKTVASLGDDVTAPPPDGKGTITATVNMVVKV